MSPSPRCQWPTPGGTCGRRARSRLRRPPNVWARWVCGSHERHALHHGWIPHRPRPEHAPESEHEWTPGPLDDKGRTVCGVCGRLWEHSDHKPSHRREAERWWQALAP